MRRCLSIVLLVSASVSWVRAECQCPPMSSKEQTEAATYIFNADVWDVELSRPGGHRVITLDVSDTFKGDPAARLELTDQDDGKDCATDFHEGESYLVFARWQWGSTITSRCWGTKRLDQVGPDGAALGPSGAVKAKYYSQLQVYCMGRRDTPCCVSSVYAMRERGYMPQPEQGCPEEMIPDRLRCDGSFIWCVPAADPHRHNK